MHVTNTILSTASHHSDHKLCLTARKAFDFVEGVLVKALRNGDWILLDEINLATSETLECLNGVLDGGSLMLTERGDMEQVVRCAFFDRILHSRMPLDPTHGCLKRTCV